MQRKRTFLLLGITAVLLIGSAIACLWILHYEQPEKIAEIYQNDTLLYRIDLNQVTESYTITINGDDGAENVVLVEPGAISMQSANCTDELCVNQGKLTGGLVPIVCLPHQIRISITTNEEASYDVEVY